MEDGKLTVSKYEVEFLHEIAARYKQSDSNIEQSMGEGIALSLEILELEKGIKN